MLELTDIEPLLQLSVVERIYLWLDADVRFEVRDIQLMGQTWRRLKALLLYGGPPIGPLSRLVTFAESFPVLEHLVGDFDYTGQIPRANDVMVRFKSLHKLTLADVTLDHLELTPIAGFLSIVCGPRVDVGLIGQLDPEFADDAKLSWSDDSGVAGALRTLMGTLYRVQEGIRKMH